MHVPHNSMQAWLVIRMQYWKTRSDAKSTLQQCGHSIWERAGRMWRRKRAPEPHCGGRQCCARRATSCAQGERVAHTGCTVSRRLPACLAAVAPRVTHALTHPCPISCLIRLPAMTPINKPKLTFKAEGISRELVGSMLDQRFRHTSAMLCHAFTVFSERLRVFARYSRPRAHGPLTDESAPGSQN